MTPRILDEGVVRNNDAIERSSKTLQGIGERMKPSVGMRNTIVHEYVNVDYAIVAAAVPLALETYAEYRRQVARFVSDRISASPEAG